MNIRLRVLALAVTCGVLVSACATTNRGLVTTPCNAPDSSVVVSTTLPPSLTTQTLRYVPPGDGLTCIELQQVEPSDEHRARLAAAGITDLSPTIGFGTEDALQTFLGGGWRSELRLAPGDWQGDRLALRQQTDGRPAALTIRNPGYGIGVNVFHNVDPEPWDIEPPELQTVELPPVDCRGRLRGYRPIDEYGDAVTLHPPMPRAMVGVRCTATWLVPGRTDGSAVISVTSGFDYTNDEGRFSLTVGSAMPVTFRSTGSPMLVSVVPECIVPEQCGHERRTSLAQTLIATELDDIPDFNVVDILNVLDIASQGPSVTGVDGTFGARFMLGARLVSRADTFPERNDKPFIIHEQLDALNAEFSNFVAWGFSGQPVRTVYTDDDGNVKEADPAREPCGFDPYQQVCLQFSEDCNPETCDDPNRGCLEYDMLSVMLDAGYDVWFVDHLRGQEDIAHIAAAAPLLYQRILNYGTGPGLFVPLPAVVPQRIETFSHRPAVKTPAAAIAAYEHHVLDALPPLTQPLPRSGDRRAVVSGFSLGGVIARLGLRLWEIRDTLPHDDLVDHNGDRVVLASASNVLLEPVERKIGLYVSLDAPHRGARTPLAIQAYARRLGRVIDVLGELSESDRRQVTDVIEELDALPTRQTLVQEIQFNGEEPLGCFKIKGEKLDDAGNCAVWPFSTTIKTRVGSEIASAFRLRWTDLINGIAPGSLDGLPATIPSIAISNGERGERRGVPKAEVMNLKFDVNNYFDFDHRMCDEYDQAAHDDIDIDPFDMFSCGEPAHQPAGSEWNNVCRRISQVRFDKEVDVEEDWFGSVGDFLGSVYSWAAQVGVRGVSITYAMSAAYDSNGAREEGTSFPTLVPTPSSLLLDERGRLSQIWRDAIWQPRSEYHTNVDNDICRMVLFHADGVFDDDADGWVACGENVRTSRCENGGRFPGGVLGAQPLDPLRAPCDCRPNDPASHPGAPEKPFDLVDNNCNGQVDEALVFE